MTWLRIDDGFVEHPKIDRLSDRAFRLHMAGLCYCARNLTDGVLTGRATKAVCAITNATRRHVVELRDASLWRELEDGWLISDYLEYNPSADHVKAKRAARQAAGRAGADSRWHGKRDSKSQVTGDMHPDPGPSQALPVSVNPTEPVGHIHDFEALKAAAKLLEAIPHDGRDSGTEAVVLAAARTLDAATLDGIRQSLESKLAADGLFKAAGAYVNGALQKAIRKAAA